MDALLAALLPVLPEMTVGTAMFAFAMWRERAHAGDAKRWTEERAALITEKRDAVKEVRDQHAEDDKRRADRIADLVRQRDDLERELDEERQLRRAAEDNASTVRLPRHRLRDEGTTS